MYFLAWQVTRVEIFGLGRAFPWGGNAQFALAGFLLPQECVEEKVEAAVVRVSLGIKECGKAHSILKPMLLFWWKKV